MIVMQGPSTHNAEICVIRGWLFHLGWHERCSSSPRTPKYTLKKETSVMLWTILVILLVLWLVGLLSHVGGSLIHLLLVVAVVVLIINLVSGRRAV